MLFKLSSRRRRFSDSWRHRYSGGEQAPIQGRPRCSDPDLSAVRKGDLSDRLHRARSTVSWSALVDRVELSGNVVAMYEGAPNSEVDLYITLWGWDGRECTH